MMRKTIDGEGPNCRLCSNPNLKLKFHTKGETLLKCDNCDLLQVADKPSQEKQKSIYSDNYFTPLKYNDTATLKKENERRLKLIKEFIQEKEAKILDFGCATGDFITYAKTNFDMWGFDLSHFAINEAKKYNPEIEKQLSSGDFSTRNYPPELFNGILLWDVIEHLWDPLEILKKLIHCLKPGGFLFISTPNSGSLMAKIMGKYWAFMTPPEHLSFFSKKTATFLTEDILKLKVKKWFSKGKWVNFGFFLYKIKRIVPFLIPTFVLNMFKHKFLNRIAFYVPTGDIQYLVIKTTK
jgi:2-polyprenyl-3-methyl-5-hydroxy-6-metoxy-1,4-benzoquinol methylase